MRKLILAAFVVAVVALLAHDRWTQLPDGLRQGVRRVGLPFQLARLSAQAPEEKIAMPVRGLRASRIVDTWHAPRSDGRRHEGQDIFAPRGTPVYSATKGYVWRVGENRLGGKVVYVIGAGGRGYYYAHLDTHEPGLEAGDYVTPETVLGYVGTTGNAAGASPHLHFGVYAPTGAINPLPLLTD